MVSLVIVGHLRGKFPREETLLKRVPFEKGFSEMRPEGRGGGRRRDQHEPGRFWKRHLSTDAPRPFRNKEAKDYEELDVRKQTKPEQLFVSE